MLSQIKKRRQSLVLSINGTKKHQKNSENFPIKMNILTSLKKFKTEINMKSEINLNHNWIKKHQKLYKKLSHTKSN